MQGFQALDHLPALTASHEKIEMRTEFVVNAQKEKLKNMCDKKKNELFSHSEKSLCKCDLFGSNNLKLQTVFFLLL